MDVRDLIYWHRIHLDIIEAERKAIETNKQRGRNGR